MIYRVLIVEDDLAYKPLWAEILRRNLKGNHPDIHWAVSAEQAKLEYEKSLASGEPFHFIITDLFLAGSETGLDFVENIFAKVEKAPPMILISSVDKEEVESIVDLENGKIEVLTKPINAVQFKEVLRKITEAQEAV